MSPQSVLVSLILLVAIGCSGSQATRAPIVQGDDVQLSIPAGWVDAAESSKAMPAGKAKSEYVVGVQSKSALDGFNPNFNVFANSAHQVDWAAGNGLSAPNVTEVAAYKRKQVTKVPGIEVTSLTDSHIAGEPASEFALSRTVDKCNCVLRQTSIIVAHGGMFYTGIFTAADKSTKVMTPILANLRASWRWRGQTVSTSPVPTSVASYTAGDVLLTLADLPDAFQPVDNTPSIELAGGAQKIFQAATPNRVLLTLAVVWPDEGQAETYRARRARMLNIEIGELTIAADSKALLPESRMYGGIDHANGKSYEWFRIVWRDRVTVNEVASRSAPEAFSQSDIIGLALKQAAHIRFAAAGGTVELPSPKSIQPAVGSAQEVGERVPVELATHISAPDRAHYAADPPTSGPHYSARGDAPVAWGFYDHPLRPEQWIHNLEHGGVVILYSCTATKSSPEPCSDVQRRMIHFVATAPPEALFNRVRIVATEYAVPGHRFAIVAWGWRLFMDTWDDALAERFYEAHVDNGPERVP